MARSLNTVLTTLFTLTALFVLGGATIHGFALALIVGIISGCYSSIFTASPIVVLWYAWAGKAKTGAAQVLPAVAAATGTSATADVPAVAPSDVSEPEVARPSARETMREAERAAQEEKRQRRRDRRKQKSKKDPSGKRKKRF